MNGHGISEYPAKTRKYGVFTLSFIIVIGMGFCYVDLFTDAGWKSKWYWLYTAVSVCGLSFFLTGAGRPETGKTFRVVGNFDNPAGYASMLALSVPFILYFALSGRRRMRYAVGVVCAIVVGAIVLSGSRTGILAVAATGLLYAVRRRSDFLRRTTAWKKIVLAATAVSVAAGLYFIKKESADGRLLIGRCTWEMIREKPLTGHGYRCFEAGYMLRQARYFERNPESGFAPLADNVKHPFNEFLLLTAEFGAVALLLTALWIASLIRAYRKNPNDESYTLATALSAAAALCCFSYPLSYPFTGSIVALAAGLPSRAEVANGSARGGLPESSPRCRPPRCWDLQRKKCITKTDGTACRKPHRPIARRCRNTSDCTRFWIKTLISSTITQRN